jgi:cell division transport system ATP-binding protein
MIELDGVTKRYPDGHEVLSGVNLEIAAGEMVFLSGHSGAGKSTLLRLVAGLDLPSGGVIRMGEQELSRMNMGARSRLRQNIGLVFQNRLLMDRTVWQNTALPLEVAGESAAEIENRVTLALERVGLLDRARQMPVTLSGGEQQRLSIARAIVNRPRLVLADEPTGNLDAEYAGVILEIFRSFHQAGVTLLIATHDERAVQGLNARMVRLERGRVVEDSARGAR